MIIVLIGPTCTGKSKSALTLAAKFNAEIINGDAYQIYKEMNIGVAKPTNEDLKLAPHHLYSFVDVNRPYSIKDYQDDLRREIDLILEKGKNVIIVGGSGLYIRAGLYDYSFIETTKEIDISKYEELSNEELHKILEEIDPVDALKIHPNNRKRLLRAIAIYLESGKSKTELNKDQKHAPIYKDIYFFSPFIDRIELAKKISDRVDYMFLNGLKEEVTNLFNKYDKDIQAMQAIGYKEFIPYFNNEKTIEEVKSDIILNTKRYAKRQETFIRHQFDVTYYHNDDDELISLIENIKR